MSKLDMDEVNSMHKGKVHGPFLVENMVCQKNHMLTSKVVFLGSDPLKYAMPLLLLQMAIIIVTSRLLYRLLKPLKQGMISAQVLAGIILGPSLIGQNLAYKDMVFPMNGKITLQTLANLGFFIHLFLLGLRIDASIIRKAGSKAILIGTASYAFPFSLGNLTVLFLKNTYKLSPDVVHCIGTVISLNAMTSFPVTTTVLAELNILNSDLGRLATNCSIVCEAFSWIVALVFRMFLRDGTASSIWSFVWVFGLILVIFFICRPAIIWLTERRSISIDKAGDIPFFPIIMILLVISLTSEVLGVHAAFGAFWLGVSLPDGPPLGTGLSTKLDMFATSLTLPCFIAISGLQTNFFVLGKSHVKIIEAVILITYGCKFLGTAAASAYCNIQVRDAFCLALLMCCQGVIEIYTCVMWRDEKVLNTECFNLLIITLLLVTGISRFLVVYLYDPSKRYRSTSKRTILNTRQRNLQFRLLLCVYNVENVPSMVNLLEASYPSRFSPISVFTLHLVELKGRAHAVLVPHHQMNKLDPNTVQSTQIVNGFQRFEQQNQGTLMAQHFTAAAPFSSINDDICTLALDKKATLVIIPFHKQYAIDGTVDHVNPAIRSINLNVLDKAPCSVGIFIDRGETEGRRSVLMSYTWRNVAVIYIEGRDDAEALAFSMRIAEHPEVNVTMLHFRHKGSLHQNYAVEEDSEFSESHLINDFKSFAMNKPKVSYREEIVRDGVETTQVISTLGDSYDLVIVGRDHDLESSVLYGLTDWSECPELGVIGDMFASPDFHFSVLVIHQQEGESLAMDNSYKLPVSPPRVGDPRVQPHFTVEEGFTSVDLHNNR
ncbi:PREDICTED: cation/H(+) antiporter 14-like [Camelina sativa]|uniref:Cation/H(+) antiporter 14-like n=1 Tax=Camelina sativa TaxID=90675 RepID=A0ABM0WSA0_CAMSA|nr:PREDICTED: cation/H(+) antiporter 14-like [Camelina sativa]